MKIHPEIKKILGFDESLDDKEFKKLWKRKSNQVCKPCWELKYCPYGPLVEQMPLLPSLKSVAISHNEYLKKCLSENSYGEIYKLNAEEHDRQKERLEFAEEDIRVLLPKVLRDRHRAKLIKHGEENDLSIHELYKTPLENLEKYQVPFSLDKTHEEEFQKYIEEYPIDEEILTLLDTELERLREIVKTKQIDNRKALDSPRRKSFEQSVDEFDENNYPEYIPDTIKEKECSIFGHICPVVYVAESITETTEERRRGRYIPFKIKIRVVRRDNYTCQECKKHLQDNEVEFDHIIPVAKGGSSEEHNIRLTCYDCNRDKSDNIEI